MNLKIITWLLIVEIFRYQIVLTRPYCKHYINNQSSYVNVSTVLLSKNMDVFLEKISLKCKKNKTFYESVNLDYQIKMYKGFEIKNSELITIKNYNDKFVNLKFNIEFCFFQFYKETYNYNENRERRNLKLLDESSSFDLLENYHDLNNLKNKNVSALYEKFTSLFTTYKMKIIFQGSNFIKNKFSRLLFKETSINKIEFYKFTNTSLRKHFVEFNQEDDLFHFVDLEAANKATINSNRTKVKLNSQINYLGLCDIYNVDLSEGIIDKYVYRRAENIMILGSFLSINDFTFKSFQFLYEIRLILSNPREFWHNSADHKWLIHINSMFAHNFTIQINQTNNINEKIIKWYKRKNVIFCLVDYFLDYDYSDEDICLFRNFPHRNTVLFYPRPTELTSREKYIFNVNTCTSLHLSRYSFLIKHLDLKGINHERFVYEQTLFQSCDLDALIRNCSLKNDSFHKKVNEINIDDFVYSLGWIELIGPIITFPIVSFIGIVTNLLVIITIKLKRNKSFFTKTTGNQTRMFDYLVINSTFNIIQCTISSFTLMSECLGLNSVFCYRIQVYAETKYFKNY